MNEKKCWLCHRTKKESLDEFKKTVIEKLKLSEDQDDQEQLNRLLEGSHHAFPAHGDFEQLLYYNIAIDDHGRRYIDDDTVGTIYGEIYLCPVCSSILTGIEVQSRRQTQHETGD